MERKIYLYDRGFWVLFRMLGIFAAALSLFLTLCFTMWIREWAFLLAILAGIVATVALLMHSRCTKRQYVVLADGRLTVGEVFGQAEKTFPLDWINEAGNGISPAFADYCLPLLGEVNTEFANLRG